MRASLLPLLPCLFLLGCTGELTVDVVAAPPQGATALVLKLKGVELLTDNGDLVTVELKNADTVDLLDYGSEPYRLITDEDLDQGSYNGIRLLFADDGNYIERSDGTRTSITISDTSSFADIDLDIAENDKVELTDVLDLQLSLSQPDGGTVLLQPVEHTVKTAEAAQISGIAETDVINSSACVDDGLAAYVFPGLGVVADDYDGEAAEPVATAAVDLDSDSGNYRYEIPFIGNGSYTVALTCNASLENGSADDALTFIRSAGITVDEGESGELNFR